MAWLWINRIEAIVVPEELADLLAAKENKLRVLNCTHYLPEENKDALAEHLENRIPGSQFFDINSLTTKNTPNPYMLPKVEVFSEYMKRLNLKKEDHVICYDNFGIATAPYAWWTLKYFGFENVRVLDGGFPIWSSLKLPISRKEPEEFQPADLVECKFISDEQMRIDLKRIQYVEMLSTRGFIHDQIVDFRSANYQETDEKVKSAKANVSSLATAINIPAETLLNPDKVTLRQPKDLYFYFTNCKLNLAKPIIAYSKTGMKACLGLLALLHSSAERLALYDGGWLEYVAMPGYDGYKPSKDTELRGDA